MPFRVSEADVAAAAAALGAGIPASHRTKLMNENGGDGTVGRDAYALFKILDSSTRKRLARTWGTPIVQENETAPLWGRFPDRCGGLRLERSGDYLVYLRAGDRLGPQVFWWDHETGEIHHVVNDFGDLLGP